MPLVSDQIAATLKAYGTEVFFQLTGGDTALWIALRDAGIRMILCRSEQAATYMADGYARISGRPAFVYGQAGPGAGNVVASLPDALWGGSPVVALSSSVPSASRDHFAYQELDQLALFAPVTKWSKAALRVDHVGPLLRDAIRAATAAPAGPVHFELARDMLKAPIEGIDARSDPDAVCVPGVRGAPEPSRVAAALSLLARAERPVILAGAGVVASGAWDELRLFAEATGLPVATTVGGKGAIAEDHPQAMGVVGRYSRKAANDLVASADAVLVVGSRLGARSTNGYAVPGRTARIAHVDVDANVFGVNYSTDVRVLADAKLALAALARGAASVRTPEGWRVQVAERIAGWKREVRALVDAKRASRPLHPAVALDVLRSKLGPRDIVVADTGYMAAWAGVLYETRVPGKTFICAAGSLGWAIPAALGAALAAPDRRVVCVTGDGGAGYHIAELETAARLRIPAIILVLNNRSLAFEYHEQRYHWGNVVPEANDFSDIDHGAVARAFGAHGARVDNADGLAAALDAALASSEPVLIDVLVDKEAIAPVTNFESVAARTI
jgi:acetolactate synthase I/II/III large subunit